MTPPDTTILGTWTARSANGAVRVDKLMDLSNDLRPVKIGNELTRRTRWLVRSRRRQTACYNEGVEPAARQALGKTLFPVEMSKVPFVNSSYGRNIFRHWLYIRRVDAQVCDTIVPMKEHMPMNSLALVTAYLDKTKSLESLTDALYRS